jgi:carbamoyl-phosphate synthase large subunit
MNPKTKVMIAGIGGASLGTEIRKCLDLAGNYEVFGCDISRTAFGLYESEFSKTWLLSHGDYVASVLHACHKSGAQFLIPGGEQPMVLLSPVSAMFEAEGIQLLANTEEVIKRHSDKEMTFAQLAGYDIPIPQTVALDYQKDLEQVGLPCIVKPATGSGGSAAVFFAVNADEAMIYADFIRRSGEQPIAQEYVSDDEGEYTIGVLSLPDGSLSGSIALRRTLDSKLSVAYRGRGGLISSGYTQGHIGEYRDLCIQAETIAEAIGSRGPINIQGRVRDGVLLPFEINPRFSASTYLRAMAGFNEIDMFIRYLLDGESPKLGPIRYGWYLRSLTEQYVADTMLK